MTQSKKYRSAEELAALVRGTVTREELSAFLDQVTAGTGLAFIDLSLPNIDPPDIGVIDDGLPDVSLDSLDLDADLSEELRSAGV